MVARMEELALSGGVSRAGADIAQIEDVCFEQSGKIAVMETDAGPIFSRSVWLQGLR